MPLIFCVQHGLQACLGPMVDIICDFIKCSFSLRVVMVVVVVDIFDYYSKAPLIAFSSSDYYDLQTTITTWL
jgi:hypothetical protein